MSRTLDSNLTSLLTGKTVIVDTSSLLISGTQLLNQLQDCALVIPSIVVRELEDKREHPILGYFARQWINLLESLRVENAKELSQGVRLKGSTITLRVEPNHTNQEALPEHLRNKKDNDSTILSVAKNFAQEDPELKVAILSNDAPMRLHASLELDLEAYEFGSTEDEPPFDGRLQVELTPATYNKMAKGMATLEGILEKLPKERPHRALVEVVLQKEVIARGLLNGDQLTPVGDEFQKHSAIIARTVEQNVAYSYLAAPPQDLPIVSIAGRAGTGKTLLSLATALEVLRDNKDYSCYQKIIVFRSLHEMGQGQEMGFLPGDVDEKMSVWGGAIGDALEAISAAKNPIKRNDGPGQAAKRKQLAQEMSNNIELSPITYLRGRSLSSSFIILDEAQNFSRNELLNIISRVGENSKVVLLFDADQVDSRFLKSGKQAEIWSIVKDLKKEDFFGHITLTKTERSKVAEVASKLLSK